jgi:hypothetical protein
MAVNQNNQATQQGIIGQQIFINNQQFSNQKYGEVLNLNNNTKYSISPNAVKLLPLVSNDKNYVKLYTERNASVNIGDMVYIMYDENMSYDPDDKNVYPTGRTILDSYYEFSGCTDWIYLKQIQGYEVIDINETNNEITIKRFYDSSLNDVKLYNHYLCKIYVNEMKFYGGWIDGVCFRTVELNNTTDTFIDVDIKQCIVLSGTSSFFTDMKDKYDSQYVSVNSDLTAKTKKIPMVNPYKYQSSNVVSTVQPTPTTSYFTYNNKSFGYSYLYFTKFYNSKIENGYYSNCIISGGTITSGNFVNCNIYDATVQSGSFVNCTINPNTTWYYGIWFGSGSTSFGPSVWYNGVWNEGLFSGKTWMTGIFNAGVFRDSVWKNGIFNGGGSMFYTNNGNFINSFWSGGTFNFGYFKDSIWLSGRFNGGQIEDSNWFGGTFNSGTFLNSFWSGGTFNNGTFNRSFWFDGNFNNGNFNNSIWYNGFFNNGIFKTGYGGDVFQVSATTYKWYNGTFNYGEFRNSIWLNGTFNGGLFDKNSLWSGGTFNFGEFDDSVWLYGNWNNGVVNNSIFHRCNWKQGTFNSGQMGKEYYISNPFILSPPAICWSGGTFNSGIFGSAIPNSLSKIFWFGGDFFGGRFYNYLYPTKPTTQTSGFFDGIFHEGFFYGDYWGGHWISGYFSNTAYNHTNQLIPVSVRYNYLYIENTNITL